MSEFNFDIEKHQGLPKLPDNYWKNQSNSTNSTESFSDINTIFDKNLKASLEDVSIFGKPKIDE